ncbi:pentatricopeptide repeat-containing protein At1g20230 [Ricinus communis]|uniref:Pentatricopeptide repeat-containing protein, putative n=1 Tax=Ricinus communis TaxID=3988 RepID=B9RGR0_RICCO|nr:pentatricopeptide repeat-containing protein At1g20230 [Ricinus communis]EEF49272.1 pentatricopeptide repeat-containing protein, putative [Ricinus communis]|eukprot:XP_002512769.1 pentatricopeptide repeat-containing protein At1g20230 [Ricinus communis]
MVSKLPANLQPCQSIKLIKTCLNSGDLKRALYLFDKIPEPDLRTWTILISGHTQHGFPKKAIDIYSTLLSRNVRPDKFVLLSVAKACAASGDLVVAKKIHDDAIQFGFNKDLVLGNALIDMFGKCKFVNGARCVFDDMVVKDVVSWTSMTYCYVNCGMCRQGILLFREMGLNGIRANSLTVSSILPACADYIKLGREVHGFILRNEMEGNVYVSSALVNMYASSLGLKQARLVFDSMYHRDIVSWNVMLTAYFLNKEYERGLGLFHQMRKEGIKLNQASWNAAISGCMQNGQHELALGILCKMQDSGIKPNRITIVSALPGCTNLESLRGGKEIHGYVFRHWFIEDVTITTALVLLYAKCGDLELSRHVFNTMPRKDVVAWNTMIMANSMHGKGGESLILFNKMLDSGVEPNSVTFIGVLSGCSHSQLADEGLLVFNSMSSEHSITPDADHYSCMVDVLSRAGRLEEAYDFIRKMPIEPTAAAWGALLGACRVYKNVELGTLAASQLFEIEPDNAGNYVLLSNILVTAKKWVEASEIRKMMRDKGLAKTPGRSWVQVKNKVYSFVTGDKSNEQKDMIYRFLDEIDEKMRLDGYQPNTDFVLQNVDQEQREETLCSHSERLAVAFGILNSSGKTTVRVFKNLRICGDCHNAIKLIAKIVGMQIIVRDSLRFHHFRDGYCTCNDFW